MTKRYQHFFGFQLQDLPLEMSDAVLMKVFLSLVCDGTRVRSTWDTAVDEVVKQLRTVWSQWNYRLTTRWFKIVLRRRLNDLGENQQLHTLSSNEVLISI